MANTESSSSSSSLKTYWKEWKEFYGERFSFVNNYKKQLPTWSESDVQAFIDSDPVHGPAVKAAREATKISMYGAAIGAISSAAFAYKYSKSPHGAVLALGAGGVFGTVFGAEAGNHMFQLYRLDTVTAQKKFMEWWENKSEGRSGMLVD
ncbi:succinate dehydrogenase [Ranunculus cassubicifolius]